MKLLKFTQIRRCQKPGLGEKEQIVESPIHINPNVIEMIVQDPFNPEMSQIFIIGSKSAITIKTKKKGDVEIRKAMAYYHSELNRHSAEIDELKERQDAEILLSTSYQK